MLLKIVSKDPFTNKNNFVRQKRNENNVRQLCMCINLRLGESERKRKKAISQRLRLRQESRRQRLNKTRDLRRIKAKFNAKKRFDCTYNNLYFQKKS